MLYRKPSEIDKREKKNIETILCNGKRKWKMLDFFPLKKLYPKIIAEKSNMISNLMQ